MIQWLAFAAMAIALLSLIGWGFKIEMLTRWSSAWVTMKPITSLAVLVAGATVAASPALRRVDECLQIAMSAIGAYMLAMYFFGASESIARIDDPAWSSAPGVPSAGTFAAVVLFGFAAHGYDRIWSALVVIAAIPLLGYLMMLFGASSSWAIYLTWYVPGWSTAMAFPTAAGFVLIAIAGMNRPAAIHR